jgi:hypothetical protein
MMTRPRWFVRLPLVAATCLSAAVVAPSPASALPAPESPASFSTLAQANSGSQSYSYRVTSKQWLADAKTCVYYALSGTLRWHWVRIKGSDGVIDYLLDDQRLVNPRIEIVTRTSCSNSGVRKTMKKATVTQAWWYYSCSTNASVYGEVPWAVGVQVTPECGKRRATARSTTYGKGSQYIQSNSGSPGAGTTWWRTVSASPQSAWQPCTTRAPAATSPRFGWQRSAES